MEYKREDDKLQSQIVKISIIVAALGIIGGGFFWLGGTQFANKETNTQEHVEIRQDVLLMKNDLVYIKDGIKEIKEAVKK